MPKVTKSVTTIPTGAKKGSVGRRTNKPMRTTRSGSTPSPLKRKTGY